MRRNVKHALGIALAAMVLFAGSTQASANSIVIGDGADGSNFFPFTGDGFAENTRYQQVYDSSFFSGPLVELSAISFFNENSPGAVFETADYTFTFSTSQNPVDALNTSDLDANVGPDATLFASVNLSGSTGAKFTISAGDGGGSPFLYDPSQGDLLVDIVRSNQDVGSGSGFLDAFNGNAGGIFSRAHNFDSGFEGFGLKTEFSAQVVPEPSTLVLSGVLGTMMVGAVGWRRRRQNANASSTA